MSSLRPAYDEAYYADYDGSRYERSEQWLGVFRHFAHHVVRTLRPTRVLDAGCAIGLLVEAFDEQGVESFGFDLSEYAIGEVPDALKDRCWTQSLTDPIDGTYDLVTCIEVIEHLPASEAALAVERLCSATDAVLFSSTPEEHEEPTHLNVQPPEYWSALFAANGFFREVDYDASFLSPWAVLYRRRDSDPIELVRGYDRALWRQRDENQRMRAQLLETSSERGVLLGLLTDTEIDDMRAAADPAVELQRRVDELRAQRARGEWGQQVAELEHRILVMKDELLAAQRQAGEQRGRAAELQAELFAHGPLRELHRQMQAERDEAVRALEEIRASTSWRVSQAALAPYRRLVRRRPASS